MSVQGECASASANQRRHYRHKIRNLAYVTLGPDNGGILRDVSETGLAIQSVRPLAPDESVALRFELLRPKVRIEGSARVVWTDSTAQAGLQLVEISARCKRLLKQWLFTQIFEASQASSESLFTQPASQVSAPAVPEELVSAAVEAWRDGRPVRVPWWPFAMSSGRFSRLVDGLVVCSGVLLFCVIALGMTNTLPSWPVALLLGIVLTAMFSGAYWILFTIFMGATPGVIMAGCISGENADSEEDDRPRFR